MKPHVVLTAANRGIGFALAHHYAEIARVTALVRTTSEELRSLPARIIDGVDLATAEGPAAAKRALGNEPIDLLLNVAGVMHWEEITSLDDSLLLEQFAINAAAPLRLTAALLDNLRPGAKVVFLTSRLGSIGDVGKGGGYGYRMSKAALNMAAKTLSIDLAPRGVAVGLFHPGSVKTSLNKLGGEIDVAEAVAGLVARIDELSLASTGAFRHQNGNTLPW